MFDSDIKSLQNLNSFRTAPNLSPLQKKKLLAELLRHMGKADWFTVGIMASSANLAISQLREMESFFGWPTMKIISKPTESGPVFLKANQNTNDVYLRIEHGLGEGILISCQMKSKNDTTETFGPLPFTFFIE